MKAYWPYLPISAIVGLGIVVNALLGTGQAVLGSRSDIQPGSLLAATNQERRIATEQPLRLDHKLAAAAQAKANDMVARNYWSHDTPDGKQPWSFVAAAGYNYQAAGENLAYGFASAPAVLRGWMNSSEHRQNVLNAGYQDVGFGIASSPDFHGSGPEVVVVAMYGTPVSNGATNISFKVKQTSPASNVLGSSIDTSSRPVSRLQLLADGAAPWTATLTSIVMVAALLLFVLRHGRSWHRVVVRSEAFVVHHPWLDVVLVLVGTAGFILTRVSGFIS